MIVDDELVLGPVDAFVGITEVVTIGVVVEALDITAVVEVSLSTICPFKITDQQINSNPNLAISAALLKYVATEGTPK